ACFPPFLYKEQARNKDLQRRSAARPPARRRQTSGRGRGFNFRRVQEAGGHGREPGGEGSAASTISAGVDRKWRSTLAGISPPPGSPTRV
ncbi:unnamed protein product, partial [Musa textilis]